ncbi:MAG: recombination protein RmuC, partial [Pseudomonadota bacterium]
MAGEVILFLLIGLAIGAAGGWFAGSRPAADLRQRLATGEEEAKALDARFKQAIADLAAASERAQRADSLAEELNATRERAEGLSAELATMKANAVHLEEQKAALLTAQENLRKEFEAAGARVLAQAQETFLNRAQERFA